MRPGSSGPSVDAMPRYLVERTFANGFHVGAEGAEAVLAVVERHASEGVPWLHSYVSGDGQKTFCVYDAQPGGDPDDGCPEPSARRSDHEGASPRPLPVPTTRLRRQR